MHQLTTSNVTTWERTLEDVMIGVYLTFAEICEGVPFASLPVRYFSIEQVGDIHYVLLDMMVRDGMLTGEEATDALSYFNVPLPLKGPFLTLDYETGQYVPYDITTKNIETILDDIYNFNIYVPDPDGSGPVSFLGDWPDEYHTFQAVIESRIARYRLHSLIFNPMHDDPTDDWLDVTRFEDGVREICYDEDDINATLHPTRDGTSDSPYEFDREHAYKGGGFTCIN